MCGIYIQSSCGTIIVFVSHDKLENITIVNNLLENTQTIHFIYVSQFWPIRTHFGKARGIPDGRIYNIFWADEFKLPNITRLWRIKISANKIEFLKKLINISEGWPTKVTWASHRLQGRLTTRLQRTCSVERFISLISDTLLLAHLNERKEMQFQDS